MSHSGSSGSFALARSVHTTQDNFAHNQLSHHGLRTIQTFITVNVNGDYGIYYTRVTDPLVISLNLGHQACSCTWMLRDLCGFRDHLSAESGTCSWTTVNSCSSISIYRCSLGTLTCSLVCSYSRPPLVRKRPLPNCTRHTDTVVMKGGPLLGFKLRASPRQMPSTEMLQAKCQIKRNMPLPFCRTLRSRARKNQTMIRYINASESLRRC